jgi:diguanylate cyclase (GGDEF)-like protein
MDWFVHIDINIFSIFISLLILYDLYNRAGKQFVQYRLFKALLLANIALLAIESIGWVFDGREGTAFAVIYMIINTVFYIVNPLPPFLWTIYVNYQVFGDVKQARKMLYIYLTPLIVNAVFALMNPFTRTMFYLDQNNVYHRGPWFSLMVAASYTYLLYTFIIVLFNRPRIEKRNFLPLLLFSVPPTIGGVLQAIFYGVSLIWSGMTLSLLIVYINIQNHRLNTDYLTGVFNRMEADKYIKSKIRNGSPRNSFSGILMDIDNFKEINDRYGHIAGDKILETTASLIKNALRKDDFLARYGGDEFIAIVDIDRVSHLERTVDRINENIGNFNLNSNHPFKLTVSIGYDVYKYNSGMDVEQFIKHIDALMYHNKKRRQ